ncbi:Hypothetical_protein [Hexamita inflata]|uniref:Hypothetical_protein n=1 Tax=Hexamita inflata TaxID=28002 RepID=A0AA86VJU2_9EUKA|nr:Hypothetical protein HINF_LOCUS56373 [Hexamita inflata]
MPRNEKRNRMNPSSITLNKAGIPAMPLWNYINLNQMLIQIRLSGDILGGLYTQTLKSEMSLKETNVSGYFTGTRCGALIAFVSEIITVKVQSTRVCTNNVPNIFQGSDLALINEKVQEDCSVCGDRYYAYGLCLQSLNNGVVQLTSLVCSNSFLFNGQDCVCPEGKVLNGSSCFDILNVLNQIIDKDYNLQYLMGLKSNPDVVSVDSRLLNNISALNQNLIKDISTINSNILNIDTAFNFGRWSLYLQPYLRIINDCWILLMPSTLNFSKWQMYIHRQQRRCKYGMQLATICLYF